MWVKLEWFGLIGGKLSQHNGSMAVLLYLKFPNACILLFTMFYCNVNLFLSNIFTFWGHS